MTMTRAEAVAHNVALLTSGLALSAVLERAVDVRALDDDKTTEREASER